MAGHYDDNSFCAAVLGGAGRELGVPSQTAGVSSAHAPGRPAPPLLHGSFRETVEQLLTRQEVLQAAVESCELLYRLGVLNAAARSGTVRRQACATAPAADDLSALHWESYRRSSRLVRWAALNEQRRAVLRAAAEAKAEALGRVARSDVGALRASLSGSALASLEAAATELAGLNITVTDSTEVTRRDLERVAREVVRVASELPQALQPVLEPFLARVHQAASWFDVGALRREVAEAVAALRTAVTTERERIEAACEAHAREWEAAIAQDRARSLESKEPPLHGTRGGESALRRLPFEDDGWRMLREGLREKMRAPAGQLLRALRDAPVVPGDAAVVLREAARRAGGTGG